MSSFLQAGVNLGGWLSQYAAYDHEHFRTFITEADLEQIASWGMDHVRLPVDYPVLEAAPSGLNEAGLAYVDQCLTWCRHYGLNVVLDLHKAPGFSFDALAEAALFGSASLQDRFVALWEALTRRYRDQGDWLTFELLNEVVLPDSAPWNALARRTIAAIRALDPTRRIIVGSNLYNSPACLAELDLPDDPYLLNTFHFYDPLFFTHQHAPWVPLMMAYNQTVEYPGECPGLAEFLVAHADDAHVGAFKFQPHLNRQVLEEALQPAVEFMARTGKPLYCGEYGVIDRAPMESSLRWHRDFVALLREHGIGRAVWSYKQMDFGLVDAQSRVVNEELVRIVSQR